MPWVLSNPSLIFFAGKYSRYDGIVYPKESSTWSDAAKKWLPDTGGKIVDYLFSDSGEKKVKMPSRKEAQEEALIYFLTEFSVLLKKFPSFSIGNFSFAQSVSDIHHVFEQLHIQKTASLTFQGRLTVSKFECQTLIEVRANN